MRFTVTIGFSAHIMTLLLVTLRISTLILAYASSHQRQGH